MKIRVCGIEIDKWQNMSVQLLFNSVKSTFSFDMYFDNQNSDHRKILLPGAYNQCVIVSDGGETLLTGVIVSQSFRSATLPFLVTVSGYSLTGVLDDSPYSALFSTTQSDGKTFLQICQAVCDQFGFGLLDKTEGEVDKLQPITTSNSKESESVSSYLSGIAKDSNIVLSHDENGNLVLEVATTSEPIFDFTAGMPGVEYGLSFDGQRMHNIITAASQGGAAQLAEVKNPYVAPQGGLNYLNIAFNSTIGIQKRNIFTTGYRPTRVIQTDTDATSIQDVADQALADELQAINVSVRIDRWELNNKIVKPNTIITIQNPELYLFNKIKFFVQGVLLEGDNKESTATLDCVVPEAFNGVVPKYSIFYGTNFTNFTPEKSVIIVPEQGFGDQRRAIDL